MSIYGENPCTNCTVGWVGFMVRPDGCGEEKISYHHWSLYPELSNRIIQVQRIFFCDPLRLSVRPSVRMEQLGSHWTDFHGI
jgi:hypothetical protein